MEIINAIGRRKTAVARVYLAKGAGEIKVNNRSLTDYFPVEEKVALVRQPLEKGGLTSQYNVNINVIGGGITGQAEAIRLGIARALCKENESHRIMLKKEGLLARDSRVVERKKPGRKKARRKFQFSKR